MKDPRQDAIAAATRAFDDGRFQTALAALVAFPSESQNPARAETLMAYLRDGLVPRLSRAGFDCALHENPEGHAGPFLIAARIEDADLPTILIYGHGDVIAGQAASWQAGRAPYTLTAHAGRLYGRGTADNKGQHLINIMAIEALLATRGSLGFNCKFIVEMSEETGSPGLATFFDAQRDNLRADVLVASDGPRVQADTPTLFLGARGAINFDLAVNLRDGAHHSGNWGGLLADPAMILAHALACITDARGQIAVPEWRPDSLTDAVRAQLGAIPVADPSGPAIDTDWGEAGLTPAERAYGWNAFAVLALLSGLPDAPVNAIAGQARATCQLRFVVGTDAEDILPALRRHLDTHGFGKVEVIPSDSGAFPATRFGRDHPWVAFAEGSLTRTAGKPPHVLPNLAGSLPNHCFTDILGLPTIWIPHSYRGCNQHAPDEHALDSICRESLGLMAGLFWDIGKTGGPAR